MKKERKWRRGLEGRIERWRVEVERKERRWRVGE